MRIRLGCALVLVAWLPAVQAQDAHIHFQSREEARAELTEGAALDYFDRLQPGEMRAKTGLPLQNLSLAAARDQTRAAYGAAVEEFTPAEQDALRDAIVHMQPMLQTKAPLYARTPWSFIKVSNRIEGGLPHTRGNSIVLADAVLVAMTRAHSRQAFDQPSGFWNLLLHEQTHVLQRHQPALFADLYTTSFGFRHVQVPSLPDWVSQSRVVNPDAPEVDWAFSVDAGKAQRWYLPDILLATLEHPAMPADFRVVALPIELKAGDAVYLDQALPAHPVALDSLDAFVARFPLHDEMFHPNEIAAGLLAALLSGDGIRSPEHPLWERTRRWAEQALR
jgi:hypothetical protein